MFDSLRKKLKAMLDKADGITKEEAVHITKETKVKHIFKDKVKLSEKDLNHIFSELKLELVQCDVAYETSEKILEELRKELSAREIPKDAIRKIVRETLRDVLLKTLETEEIDLLELVKKSEKPFTIIFLGVNGGGKTTTLAKVGKLFQKNDFSVVLAAGDTFRAGGIEQLEKHAHNLGIKVIKHTKGADSAAVIYDAIEHAKARKIDVILADTAGRMQSNVNLMDEMKKICRVNNPDLKIFVGEALTGNDAVSQAEMFHEAVGIDGIILTKMDADPKGGCALSIINAIKKPIIFIGNGQGYDDLMNFDPKWFVSRIVEEK